MILSAQFLNFQISCPQYFMNPFKILQQLILSQEVTSFSYVLKAQYTLNCSTSFDFNLLYQKKDVQLVITLWSMIAFIFFSFIRQWISINIMAQDDKAFLLISYTLLPHSLTKSPRFFIHLIFEQTFRNLELMTPRMLLTMRSIFRSYFPLQMILITMRGILAAITSATTLLPPLLSYSLYSFLKKLIKSCKNQVQFTQQLVKIVKSKSASVPAKPLIKDPNFPSLKVNPFSLIKFSPLNFFSTFSIFFIQLSSLC